MSQLRLKVDLHIHNSEDILERVSGTRGMPSPKEFIDLAVVRGYDAIAFTHHGLLYQDASVQKYAKSLGLLLIPGIEAFINKKHVLILNFNERRHILNFESLREVKHPDHLVIAPHPYYKASFCLERDLEENIDCFDAIEYSHFYTKWFNLNHKALDIAKKHQLPMVGCSDAHFKHQFGTTFSYVDAAEKSIPAIIAAIKAGNVEYVSTPLPFYQVFWISIWVLFKLPYYLRNFVRKMSLKYNVTPFRIRRLAYQFLSPLLWPVEAVRASRINLKPGINR